MGHSNASRLRAVPTLTGRAPALDLAALPTDPVALFWEWFDAALAAGFPKRSRRPSPRWMPTACPTRGC